MSEDENIVFMISLAGMVAAWLAWLFPLLTVRRLRRGSPAAWPVLAAMLLGGLALWFTLVTWSSHDVRESGVYIAFYLAMGAAWAGLAVHFTSWLGVSMRDDVVERQNPAASAALAGALLGVTFCYTGGNIGDGPGWWVVVYSALLATATLMVLWGALNVAADASDAVTIDRDVASGVRLGGFLAAAGLILGRAVAGDWTSIEATNIDFALMAWPAFPLTLLAAMIERICHPTPESPSPPVSAMGVAPALMYLALAGAWLLFNPVGA